MAKLTKDETKKHNQVMELINSDKALTFDEKWFIIENFHEGANNNNGFAGAFFTPILFARDFALEVYGNTVIDLCAGIGALSFFIMNTYNKDDMPKELVCVELNHSYYEVGKKVLPEADWVLHDALTFNPGKTFDQSISNPPFGNIKTSNYKDPLYTGSEFEYKIISKCSTISNTGAFILPQLSSGFKYSGNRYYERCEMSKYLKFKKDTSFEINPGIGIDTSIYKNEWKGVSPATEVGIVNFTGEDY